MNNIIRQICLLGLKDRVSFFSQCRQICCFEGDVWLSRQCVRGRGGGGGRREAVVPAILTPESPTPIVLLVFGGVVVVAAAVCAVCASCGTGRTNICETGTSSMLVCFCFVLFRFCFCLFCCLTSSS